MDSGSAEKTDVGGVEGPEAMYVKLIASDGHEFIMKRSHALTSGTIKAMLSGPGESIPSFRVVKCYNSNWCPLSCPQASLQRMKQMK